MTEILEVCNDLIAKAQTGLENTDAYMVGQQLKDICRNPECAKLVAADLENSAMGLKHCAAKIKAWADAQRKKTKASCVCVPPDVAEGIIREFYGLPGKADQEAEPVADMYSGASLDDLWNEVF